MAFDMTHVDRSAVKEHLEYLGYDVTEDEEGNLRVDHPRKPKFAIKFFPDGFMHTSIWDTSERARQDPEGFLRYINSLNQAAFVSRYYADEDLDMFIEAFYIGRYERRTYARFITIWDEDFQRMIGNPNTEKFLG